MNYAKAYDLWYMGAAEHEVLTQAKDKIAIDTAKAFLDSGTVTGKQMAEKILDNIRFDTQQISKYQKQTGEGSYAVTALHGREIEHVHAAKSAEIRSKWDVPEITDKQLEDALFTDLVADELQKVMQDRTFTVHL